MDIPYTKILDRSIDNNLSPKIILVIIYIKNIRPTSLLKDKNPHEIYFNKALELGHLQVLGSTVYVFIYKEKQNLKSEKFKAWALKSILVGYNRHTIYRVFIQYQDKII